MNRIFFCLVFCFFGCDQVEPVGVDLSSGTNMVGELELPPRVDPSSSEEIDVPNGTVVTPPIVHGQKIKSRIEGKVVRITDANTVVVLVDKQQVKVRLASIDAPERKKQPFGKAAKDALSDLIAGRAVSVLVTGKDRYGRTLGFVMMPLDHVCAEANINEWLIAKGWAWHYDDYSDSEELAEFENEAREADLGLWAGRSDLDRIPPWRWRKGLRSWKELQAGNVRH